VRAVDEDDRVNRASGRFCHSAMSSITLSVIVEMVCLETSYMTADLPHAESPNDGERMASGAPADYPTPVGTI
jgi:hypothetical protein